MFTFLIVDRWLQPVLLSTNVIGLATGNINAEFGMTLNKKFSIHCPVQYNPFVFSKSNNTKFQNLIKLCPVGGTGSVKVFRDSFIALSVIGSRYNISNIWDSYRYDGYGAGAGLSFGWTYPMAPRWNFEVGSWCSLWTSYDKFVHKKAGYKFGHEYGWHIIPHKVAVNLVYLF